MSQVSILMPAWKFQNVDQIVHPNPSPLMP